MTTCVHSDLRVEEGSHYCCAACGRRFVVMRVDEPRGLDAVDQTPSASEHVDVLGKVGPYIPRDRRLPSKRAR
jgi:hypothetical protein